MYKKKGVVERSKIVVYSRQEKGYKRKENKKVVRRKGFYLVLNTLRPLHFIMVVGRN
jgi:ribosomal protein L36